VWRGLGSVLVRLRAHAYFRRFDEAAAAPAEAQRRALLTKIARNVDSRFGRDHDFTHIDSVDAFRRRVPVSTYEYLQPYIDRVRRGDVRALFGPREDVVQFAVTSGTTSEPKYIPITRSFLSDYRGGWLIWGWGAYRDHRPCFEGFMLNVVSRPDECVSAGGIPCGAVSGLMSQMQPAIVRAMYAVPPTVNSIEHTESKYYLVLRLAMTRAVTFCCTPNPSTLLRIAEIGNARAPQLLRDIEEGTLWPGCRVSDAQRRELSRWLRPQKKQARRLAGILEREGKLLPRHYWDRMGLVAVWKGGTVSLYLPLVKEAFGPAPIRDLGLMASEGRMSIPLTDDGSAGVLDFMHQFFEFIPESEIDKEQPPTLLAHEVELGQRYYLMLTTSGGCYRYNIMDHVEVVDFYRRTPVIAFLNKGEHISSLTGEKLTENQVVLALAEAHETLELPAATQMTLAPVWDEPPYYVLVAAEDCLPPEKCESFLQRLERALCACNLEYEQKRKSGRLGRPRLLLVQPEEFSAVVSERQARMHRPEQHKHIFLIPDLDYHSRFEPLQEVTYGSHSTVGDRETLR